MNFTISRSLKSLFCLLSWIASSIATVAFLIAGNPFWALVSFAGALLFAMAYGFFENVVQTTETAAAEGSEK